MGCGPSHLTSVSEGFIANILKFICLIRPEMQRYIFIILTLPSTVHQEEKDRGLNRELGRCSVDEIRAKIEADILS